MDPVRVFCCGVWKEEKDKREVLGDADWFVGVDGVACLCWDDGVGQRFE